jgi:hypothetical protein
MEFVLAICFFAMLVKSLCGHGTAGRIERNRLVQHDISLNLFLFEWCAALCRE